MNSIKVKFTGIMIISLTIFLLFGTIFVIAVEYLGISKSFHSKFSNKGYQTYIASLVDDGYYKNDSIKQDPYAKYTVQHLHPYYVFSLPWRTLDRANLVDNVVRINSDGFRNNPSNNVTYNRTAILLGGSTAFGHFSSSDETTIASVLSRTLELNVVNRNAPSWNSHQELVALAKYFDKYSLSISFTLINDISVACAENNSWDDGLTYLDAPESYIKLQRKVNNIRGEINSNAEGRSLKSLIKSLFPETYELLWLVKESYKPLQNQYPFKMVKFWCSNVEPQDIALSFLRNQRAINELSSARKAQHVVVLQPHISLIDSHAYDYSLRNSVYDIVMNSQYCATNICIDMRNTRRSVTVDELYNGNNITTALFADRAHLTDRGVLMYSQIIAEELSKF